MTNWQEELSVRHPEALENLNRRGYIQRKDIQPYEKENPDGTTETVWKCQSRFISEEEYNLLLVQEEMNQNTNDNLLICMAAQAEIYERLLEQEQNQLATIAAIAEIYEKQNGGA
ncbi:MAG: hypothetical protein K1W37_07265 [Lachnospiraceae bacterium]